MKWHVLMHAEIQMHLQVTLESVRHDRPLVSFDFCNISRVPRPTQIENASADGTRLLSGERAQTVAMGLLFRALTTL